MDFYYNDPQHKVYRQDLRLRATEEEEKLWYELRGKKLNGIKFRRQHGVGPYILDFYCPAKRLAIEIDGLYHLAGHQPLIDKDRTGFLNSIGIKVLRFTNQEINQNLPQCLQIIRQEIEQTQYRPSIPLPPC